MLEVSDEEEADLSGLSDDSTLDATFKPAGRDGRISSSASDEELASTGQFWKIKWYVGYFIKYFLGSYNFFQYVFFYDIIHDLSEIGQVDIADHTCCPHNVVK